MEALIKAFQDLAAQYGPSVTNAALGAVRISMYSSLAAAALWFVVGLVTIVWARCMYIRVTAWPVKAYDPDRPMCRMLWCFVMGIGAIVSVVSLTTWVDPWTWAAINHPELFLAKRAFHL